MGALFQGLTDPDTGEVKISVRVSGGLPGDEVWLRGMPVSPSGEIYAVADTSQNRIFRNGIAFEEATGMLLLGSGALVNTAPGGLATVAAGSIVSAELADVSHQGVNLKDNGRLITIGGDAPQADRYVHPSGTWAGKSPVYTTIAAALTAAATDDVIEVSGGSSGIDYNEYVQISTRVHLRGSKAPGHDGWASILGTGTHCLLFRINGCTVSNLRFAGTSPGNAALIANTTITDFTANECYLEDNSYHVRTVNSTMATNYVLNRCRLDRAKQSTLFGASALNEFYFNYCSFHDDDYGASGNLGKGFFRNCTLFPSRRYVARSTGAILNFSRCIFVGADYLGVTATQVSGGANITCTQCLAFGSLLQTTPSGLLTDESVVDGGNNLSGVAAYLPVGKLYDSYLHPALTYAMLDDTENTDHWSNICAVIEQYGWKMGLGVSGDPSSAQYDTMAARIADGSGYLIGHSRTATSLGGPGPIQIAYGGAGTGTVDVTNTGEDRESATWGGSLVLKVNSSPVATFDFTNASYDTIAKMVTAISGTAGWSAQKHSFYDVSDFLTSQVMAAVTAKAVTATITDTTLDYNRDRLHTYEIGDHIAKVEAAMAARGLSYKIYTFYPHGNLFDPSTQDYCVSIGLLGMRTDGNGSKDLRSFNVYACGAVSPVQACGTTEGPIERNTAGFAENLNGLGWCVGLYSHTEGVYNVSQWSMVFKELHKHGVIFLTLDDAVRHIRGELEGYLPPGSTSDNKTYTRTLGFGTPRLNADSVASPGNTPAGPSYGDYDFNLLPVKGRTFVGAHGPLNS